MTILRLVGASERAPASARQVTASGTRQRYQSGGRYDTGTRKIGKMVTSAGTCGVCGVPHAQPCGILAKHLQWLRLKGQSEASIYCRERAVARMVAALDPVPVLAADHDEMTVWREGLDVAGGTIVAYVSHAANFLAWAVDEGIRPDNPAAVLPVPRLGRRLPRPIGEDDLMAAVETAPPRVRPWLVLAAWCGLRACEIALLRRENIQERATPPMLIIAHDCTKGDSEHVIPLCAFAVAELQAARLPAEGVAFRRMDGQRGPNKPWLISHMCNAHLHACGIPDTLHSLRHFFGTATYQSSKDLRLVQDLMGHANPSTTAGYAKWSREGAVTAVEALPTPGRRSS